MSQVSFYTKLQEFCKIFQTPDVHASLGLIGEDIYFYISIYLFLLQNFVNDIKNMNNTYNIVPRYRRRQLQDASPPTSSEKGGGVTRCNIGSPCCYHYIYMSCNQHPGRSAVEFMAIQRREATLCKAPLRFTVSDLRIQLQQPSTIIYVLQG